MGEPGGRHVAGLVGPEHLKDLRTSRERKIGEQGDVFLEPEEDLGDRGIPGEDRPDPFDLVVQEEPIERRSGPGYPDLPTSVERSAHEMREERIEEIREITEGWEGA